MLHGLSLICLNYRKPALTKILRPFELIKAGFESWWREEEGGGVVSPGRALSFVRGGEEKKTRENNKKQGGFAAEYSYIVINPFSQGVAS